MRTQLLKSVTRAAVYALYALLGAWIFMLVERKDETNSVAADRLMQQLRARMAAQYYNFSAEDLEEFVAHAYEVGRLRTKLDWEFFNSLEFAVATLTTIGYGDITPETQLGQGLTVVYAMFGLPITVLLLKSVGQYICVITKTMVVKLEKDVLKRAQVKSVKIKVLLATHLIAVMVIISSALVTTYTDDLTFLEGIYMWGCTFTTIGFGDYVPFKNFAERASDKNAALYYSLIILTSLSTLLGLSITAGCLNSTVDALDELRDKGYHIKMFMSCRTNATEQHTGESIGMDNPCRRTGSVMTERERAESI